MPSHYGRSRSSRRAVSRSGGIRRGRGNRRVSNIPLPSARRGGNRRVSNIPLPSARRGGNRRPIRRATGRNARFLGAAGRPRRVSNGRRSGGFVPRGGVPIKTTQISDGGIIRQGKVLRQGDIDNTARHYQGSKYGPNMFGHRLPDGRNFSY